MTNIFISAGEASGEAYGALLIDELKKRLAAAGREARFVGMGGPRMAAAGLQRIVRAEDVAVMGITEVVRHLPRIYREFRKLKQSLRDQRPSVAVLIDFPDIHFKLAKECHRLGIPVVYFVSPQLWAWKKHRIKLVQKYVDSMLVIFPFEEPFYRERGVQAEFVGHPLADLPLPSISREDFARAHDLDPAATWIGLLPGSRAKEIRDNLPEMLAAARLLEHSADLKGHDFSRAADAALANRGLDAAEKLDVLKGHDFSRAVNAATTGRALALEFILPLAPTLTPPQRTYVRALAETHANGLQLRFVDDAQSALIHARASIVASGTATVEAALIGNPFVVVYRVSPLTYAIAKRVVTVPHVAMVNLIAQKRLIPELIQSEFTASNIVRQLQPLLPDGAPRQSMMQELAALRSELRASAAKPSNPSGAIGRVAEVTLQLLSAPSPAGTAEATPS
jgi:lipid-A-disaccharide synthase